MKKLLFVFVTFLFFVFVSPTLAADFSVSFGNEYTFTATGSASVKKTFTLTNLTTANYPSEYSLQLPSDASTVVAFDEEGQTEITVIEKDDQKQVKMVFNQESLGFGKDITIVLTYDTESLAKNENNRWRVAIPGHVSQEIVDNYSVSITFPEEWGEPERVIPPADTAYNWTFSERPETPISVDFEIVASPTPTPTPSSSAFPIAVGVSIGVIIVFVLFEILRRV